MGAIYDIKAKVEDIIKERKLDSAAVRGAIGLKAGFMMAFVKPETPDDPAKLEKLRHAVALILNVRF